MRDVLKFATFYLTWRLADDPSAIEIGGCNFYSLVPLYFALCASSLLAGGRLGQRDR